MKLEFITERRLNHLNRDEIFDLIIERVMDDRILVIEREFNDTERLELMALGLERAKTETSSGINMMRIPLNKREKGLLRSKQQIRLNLFAPGSSTVKQLDDGHFSINSFDGKTVAEI